VTRSDADLLELTADKPDAFRYFYQRNYRAVLGYLLRRTANPEVAEELTSEVFAAALVKARTYRREKGTPQAWLFGIVKLTLLSSYRRHAVERSARRKLGLKINEHVDDAWSEVEKRLDSTWPALDAGLARLSEIERDAIEARYVDEREYADIALDEGASEATIRQRVSRGMKKLAPLRKQQPPF
jgi:RNA polymerase sigma factor (sigma-70 family)